jgi:acyl dehydratase
MGCTTMFVVAILGLVLILGGTWWSYIWAVDRFTSSQPGTVQMEMPSDEQLTAASNKVAAIHAATRDHQPVTVEFTAAELNALIARHPDFDEMRGKFRVAMADSILTLDMSVPLSVFPWPRIKDRWLNGTARFGLIYHDGNFTFALRSLTANDRDLSVSFLKGFAGAFNDSFNEGFTKSRREHEHAREFWADVKTLAVIDDKLVVTTMGRESSDTEADHDEAADEAEPSASPVP